MRNLQPKDMDRISVTVNIFGKDQAQNGDCPFDYQLAYA
jgi:hypothetical protein